MLGLREPGRCLQNTSHFCTCVTQSKLPGTTVSTWMPSPKSKFKPAAAAAKSLQSCPTLCDPIDSSPPGSPVPGILKARTLEWVAISFSWSISNIVRPMCRKSFENPAGLQPMRIPMPVVCFKVLPKQRQLPQRQWFFRGQHLSRVKCWWEEVRRQKPLGFSLAHGIPNDNSERPVSLRLLRLR